MLDWLKWMGVCGSFSALTAQIHRSDALTQAELVSVEIISDQLVKQPLKSQKLVFAVSEIGAFPLFYLIVIDLSIWSMTKTKNDY